MEFGFYKLMRFFRVDCVTRNKCIHFSYTALQLAVANAFSMHDRWRDEKLVQQPKLDTFRSIMTRHAKTSIYRSTIVSLITGSVPDGYNIIKGFIHPHEETRELPGERNNARNNARCTQAMKTTHGLDRQHQVVDRTLCGRVNQNDRG